MMAHKLILSDNLTKIVCKHTIFCLCSSPTNLFIVEVKIKEKKRAVCFDIKVAWLAIARMYNAEANLGDITTNIGFVLLHIDEENGTPATKIAPLMGMEARSLTRMLAKLEERNLIYRVPDEHDRRMVRIFLTEYGQERKQFAKDVVIGFNKKLYKDIPKEDLTTFFSVLDKIHKIIKAD
ncbi:MAG: MarR family transcriptional regulator [Bacteroidota bacterium]